jgi:hypothetical protein
MAHTTVLCIAAVAGMTAAAAMASPAAGDTDRIRTADQLVHGKCRSVVGTKIIAT